MHVDPSTVTDQDKTALAVHQNRVLKDAMGRAISILRRKGSAPGPRVKKAADCLTQSLIGVVMSGEIMTFSDALDALKSGEKVRRTGWNGKGMFLFLVPGSTFQVSRPPLLGIYPEGHTIDYRPHIDMKDATGCVVPWLASQTDMLADDWEIVPDTDVS